jgi:hypothetical protein
MPVTRRVVLEQLATVSDADKRETTTKAALAATLNTDEETIESHLNGLAACELAHTYLDGRVRITTTGEELLDLDTGDLVVVDSNQEL